MENTIWETSDLPLASALIAKGFKLKELDKSNYKAMFKFERSGELIARVSDYWDDVLLVSAKELAEVTRALKSRIYQQ